MWHKDAVVAELAYAHDSGSCPCTWVWVQVPSTALLFEGGKSCVYGAFRPLPFLGRVNFDYAYGKKYSNQSELLTDSNEKRLSYFTIVFNVNSY